MIGLEQEDMEKIGAKVRNKILRKSLVLMLEMMKQSLLWHSQIICIFFFD